MSMTGVSLSFFYLRPSRTAFRYHVTVRKTPPTFLHVYVTLHLSR